MLYAACGHRKGQKLIHIHYRKIYIEIQKPYYLIFYEWKKKPYREPVEGGPLDQPKAYPRRRRSAAAVVRSRGSVAITVSDRPACTRVPRFRHHGFARAFCRTSFRFRRDFTPRNTLPETLRSRREPTLSE